MNKDIRFISYEERNGSFTIKDQISRKIDIENINQILPVEQPESSGKYHLVFLFESKLKSILRSKFFGVHNFESENYTTNFTRDYFYDFPGDITQIIQLNSTSLAVFQNQLVSVLRQGSGPNEAQKIQAILNGTATSVLRLAENKILYAVDTGSKSNCK